MIQCPTVLEFPSRFHSCLTSHIKLLSKPVDFTAPFISDLRFKSFCHRFFFFQVRIQFIEMQLTHSDIPHVIHAHSVFHTNLIRYKTLTMRYSKYSFVYATFVQMTYTFIQTFSSHNWVRYFTCMFLNHCQNPNNHITVGSGFLFMDFYMWTGFHLHRLFRQDALATRASREKTVVGLLLIFLF